MKERKKQRRKRGRKTHSNPKNPKRSSPGAEPIGNTRRKGRAERRAASRRWWISTCWIRLKRLRWRRHPLRWSVETVPAAWDAARPATGRSPSPTPTPWPYLTETDSFFFSSPVSFLFCGCGFQTLRSGWSTPVAHGLTHLVSPGACKRRHKYSLGEFKTKI